MSQPPVKRTRDRFDRVALELGHISMEWGRLERALDEIIELLVPLDAAQIQINQSLTGNIDVRGKIQIVRALAFLKHKDKEWLETILDLMDKIDNDLRVKRNAVIHAGWYGSKRQFWRHTKKTKLLKPKAFSLILETEQTIHIPISRLRQLRVDLWLSQ